MNKTLSELWYSLLEQHPIETRAEAKILIGLVVRNEEVLQSTLTQQQKECLEKYEDCLNELHDFYEREAFIKGVQFATNFLVEAMDRGPFPMV